MKVHPAAEVEDDVVIGEGTTVWSRVHIRGGARIGRRCIVGESTYIAGGAVIGDLVTINAMAYICTGVTIEDGVMISAGVIFTNDRYPRSTSPDLSELRKSDTDDQTLPTLVREGATIGAGAVVGSGLEVGRFALVGMGAVVTRSVPDFHLLVGNPGRSVGAVCRCGEPVARFSTGAPVDVDVACSVCGRRYQVRQRRVEEVT